MSPAAPASSLSLAYPVGVVVTILLVSLVLNRPWTARRDPDSAARLGLVDISVEVERPTLLEDVPGLVDGEVRLSYLARGGRARVVRPGEELKPGDRVVVVGPEEAVRRARDHLGHRGARARRLLRVRGGRLRGGIGHRGSLRRRAGLDSIGLR